MIKIIFHFNVPPGDAVYFKADAKRLSYRLGKKETAKDI